MAYQTVPQCAEVVLHGSQNGIPVVNVFHVDLQATVTAELLAQVRDTVVAWARYSWLPLLNSTYTLNEVVVTDLSTEGGLQARQPLTTNNTGAVASAAIGANSALVVSWRTHRIGRSYRGRTYVGALSTTVIVDAHNATVTFAAGVADAMNTLIAVLIAAGFKLVVVSRWLNKVLRVVGLMTDIVSVVVDTKIDSQRRRTAN